MRYEKKERNVKGREKREKNTNGEISEREKTLNRKMKKANNKG